MSAELKSLGMNQWRLRKNTCGEWNSTEGTKVDPPCCKNQHISNGRKPITQVFKWIIKSKLRHLWWFQIEKKPFGCDVFHKLIQRFESYSLILPQLEHGSQHPPITLNNVPHPLPHHLEHGWRPSPLYLEHDWWLTPPPPHHLEQGWRPPPPPSPWTRLTTHTPPYHPEHGWRHTSPWKRGDTPHPHHLKNGWLPSPLNTFSVLISILDNWPSHPRKSIFKVMGQLTMCWKLIQMM